MLSQMLNETLLVQILGISCLIEIFKDSWPVESPLVPICYSLLDHDVWKDFGGSRAGLRTGLNRCQGDMQRTSFELVRFSVDRHDHQQRYKIFNS